jgi:hypothetical protein
MNFLEHYIRLRSKHVIQVDDPLAGIGGVPSREWLWFPTSIYSCGEMECYLHPLLWMYRHHKFRFPDQATRLD